MGRRGGLVLLLAAVLVLGLPVTAAAARLEGHHHLRSGPTALLTSRTADGLVAADSHGMVVGDPDAPLVTYRVEVEDGLDLASFLATVDAVLGDPRGWTARGDLRLQRVADDPDVRVVLASPAVVDERCARAGLRTNGWFSCFDGSAAMLNLDRWTQGTWRFPGDLREYRRYLVSHEVGHGLGHGHVGCPRAGAPAPVMMQQTKGLDGCAVNPWPYPDGR